MAKSKSTAGAELSGNVMFYNQPAWNTSTVWGSTDAPSVFSNTIVWDVLEGCQVVTDALSGQTIAWDVLEGQTIVWDVLEGLTIVWDVLEGLTAFDGE